MDNNLAHVHPSGPHCFPASISRACPLPTVYVLSLPNNCSSPPLPHETELAGVAISSSQRLISSEISSDHISHLQGWPIKSLKSDESDRAQRERVESMPRALTCRRWNAGVCPSSDGKCQYKHICFRLQGRTQGLHLPQQSLREIGSCWRGEEGSERKSENGSD